MKVTARGNAARDLLVFCQQAGVKCHYDAGYGWSGGPNHIAELTKADLTPEQDAAFRRRFGAGAAVFGAGPDDSISPQGQEVER